MKKRNEALILARIARKVALASEKDVAAESREQLGAEAHLAVFVIVPSGDRMRVGSAVCGEVAHNMVAAALIMAVEGITLEGMIEAVTQHHGLTRQELAMVLTARAEA